MSYLKKIGALFVSSALMTSMLAGCGSSSDSTGGNGSQAEGRRWQLQHFHRVQDHLERIHPVHDGRR